MLLRLPCGGDVRLLRPLLFQPSIQGIYGDHATRLREKIQVLKITLKGQDLGALSAKDIAPDLDLLFFLIPQ